MEGGEIGVEVGPGEGEGGGERRGVGLEVFECFAKIFFLRVDELQSGGDCFHRRHCWNRTELMELDFDFGERERESYVPFGSFFWIFWTFVFIKRKFTFINFKHSLKTN